MDSNKIQQAILAISIILLILVSILTVIILNYTIQLEQAKSIFTRMFQNPLSPTTTPATDTPPMSNTAYWDCISNPNTTWDQCQQYR